MIIFSSFVILLLLSPVLIENEEKMTSKKYTPQEIDRLILLCWHGEADKQQMTELEEWLEESADNRSFYESLGARSYQGTEWQEYMKYDSRKDWKRVKVAMKRRKRVPFRYLLPYAALVLIAIGLAWMIKYKNTGKSEQPVSMVETIRPGSSKAQLVLPDGRRVDLEVDRGCQQLKGENFVNDGKQLVYYEQENGKRIQWHTLSVPRGGEYKLVLADGTRVWLNAASELMYPDHFSADQRKVVLKGEAYFEVTKDVKRPFSVVLGDMEVKVLGTSFNVSAYPGVKRQTTLIEGQVAVNWHRQQVVIRPGQQAVETDEGLRVASVNVMNYVGWKEHRFVYENKLLGEVLEDLERWYDVEVFVMHDEIRNLHLTANLPRYENMDKVLEIIEYAACVNCMPVGYFKKDAGLKLAMSFANEKKKTLLIDLVKEPEGKEAGNSISRYVLGDESRPVPTTQNSYLDVLCRDVAEEKNFDVVMNERFASYVKEMQDTYEYIVINSPNVAESADAFAAGKLCDKNFVVCARGGVNNETLYRLKNTQQGAEKA